jgi:PQQ-like domain
VGDDVVIGTSGRTWVGRDLETGAMRWLTEAAGYQPAGAGTGTGAFIAICLSAFERDRVPVPAGAHSVVLALDPRTGQALWQTPVDGLIRSAATGPGGVSVCAELPDGARYLAVLGNDGNVSAARRLDDTVATGFGRATDGRPIRVGQDAAVVVARTPDKTLVLMTTDRLVAFDHALAPVWTIAVDPPDFGYAARIADNRLAVVTAAAEGCRVYIRGQTGLQIIEW